MLACRPRRDFHLLPSSPRVHSYIHIPSLIKLDYPCSCYEAHFYLLRGEVYYTLFPGRSPEGLS